MERRSMDERLEVRAKNTAGTLVADGLMAYDSPDEEALAKCKELGAALA